MRLNEDRESYDNSVEELRLLYVELRKQDIELSSLLRRVSEEKLMQFRAIIYQPRVAGTTMGGVIFYKPSQFFLELLEALRTLKYDQLRILCHEALSKPNELGATEINQ